METIMGLFGKSKAEKAAEEAELARQEEQNFQALIAEEAQEWIDAIEEHRNGAREITPELVQAAGELPQPGSAEDKRDYRAAAEDIARSKGNRAKVDAMLSDPPRSAEEAASLMGDYNFWLSVQNHVAMLEYRH